MDQNLKDFLKFGSSEVITKKNLWEIHIAFFFMSALLTFAMHLMETPLWTQIFLFVILAFSVLLTCFRPKIIGRYLFFTYGIMSLEAEILFFTFATFFLWMVFGNKSKWIFLLVGISCLFLLIHVGYFLLTFYLIRKGAYKKAKQASGGVCFLSFASLGILAGKLFSGVVGQETLACVIAFLMYFVAALSALGTMNLFKYVLYCKYEKIEAERQRKEKEEQEQKKLEKANKRKKHGKRNTL